MRRKEERKKLSLNGVCRTSMTRIDVTVSDISSHGCRIESKDLPLEIGQKVVLRPDGLEGLAGTIRWNQEARAGLEFDNPLHPSVVDHLCRLHPDADVTFTLDLAA